MSASWPVRTLTEADEQAFHEVDSLAFAETVPAEVVQAGLSVHEPDRRIGAFDSDLLAGIAMAYSFRLSVPGATLPAAGVSWVGVRPTHRRRGIVSALMRHQLREIHEVRREPVAVLWASEPMIYGRFGYGLAARRLSLRVPRSPIALHAWAPTDTTIRLRYVDPATWTALAGVYESVAASRPGMPDRDDRWWARETQDLPVSRDGRSELRAVVAEHNAGVRGYALFSTKQNWSDGMPRGDLLVREIVAADPPALAHLYRFLFDQDLLETTELWNVPVDDPVMHWLTNPRPAKPLINDSLFCRVVDVATALGARIYSAPVDVVIEVADEVCPWNAGRWRLRAGAGEATCARAEQGADLALPAVALGAAFLGGTSLRELAVAGQVVERRPGAVAELDDALRWFPAPWSPQVF